MKQLLFLLLTFFVIAALEVKAMPAKFTEEVLLPQVEEELKKLPGKKILVGPAAAENSDLAAIAAANEFGAEITPKSSKFLAVPANREAKENSPRDFNDLIPVFPKKGEKGTPMLVRVVNGKIIPYYYLKNKVIIPERAYMRTALLQKETIDKAVDHGTAALERVLAGTGRAEDVAEAMGLSLAASVKKHMRSGIEPRNAPLTLALKRRKGVTLIDEGRLINSIQPEVE